MSKIFHPITFVFAAILQILQFFTIGSGQSVDVSVSVDVQRSAIHVDGQYVNSERPNRRNLTFEREYAGTIGLADRFASLGLADSQNAAVGFKQIVPGEYVADADFSRWRYNVNLRPAGRPSARAHVSWIDGDKGILFLDDILPQAYAGQKISARLTLMLPEHWSTSSTEQQVSPGVFDIADAERSVIVIYRDGTLRSPAAKRARVNIVGTWQFADDDAADVVRQIVNRYEKLFGTWPGDPQITIMRFPEGVPTGSWEADTRGRSVTILSSDMPFKTQSIQRLHEQLRHELFHLWFPNGLSLKGHYDWFYEGFALYQSLKVGVGVNRLRFDDFLDSLSQALNIDRMQIDRYSLIAASEQRFQGANATVYARGMLVAFLCDIAILRQTRGKQSVEDLEREIYRRAADSPGMTNGNDAVIAAMRSRPELIAIVDKYVNGAGPIDPTDEIKAAGIIASVDNSFVRLSVVPKPDGRQRDLLDKLGYNNWRKLSEISK